VRIVEKPVNHIGLHSYGLCRYTDSTSFMVSLGDGGNSVCMPSVKRLSSIASRPPTSDTAIPVRFNLGHQLNSLSTVRVKPKPGANPGGEYPKGLASHLL
jgi:hypothetical protein